MKEKSLPRAQSPTKKLLCVLWQQVAELSLKNTQLWLWDHLEIWGVLTNFKGIYFKNGADMKLHFLIKQRVLERY